MKARGFSLIEVLVYSSILVIVIMTLFSILVNLSSTLKSAQDLRLISRAGVGLTEELLRQIRKAEIVDLNNSQLRVSNSVLSLNLEETLKTFYINDDNQLIEFVDGQEVNLTPQGITVSYFRVDFIDTNFSEGLKIEFMLERNNKTEKFYLTAVLRGSY